MEKESKLQVKIIKLITNEDIIVTIDEDSSFDEEHDMIYVMDPIVLANQNVVVNNNTMQVFFMRPWLPGSDDGVFSIPLSRIVTIAGIADKFADKYLEFLDGLDDPADTEAVSLDQEDLDDSDYDFDELFNHDQPTKPTYH